MFTLVTVVALGILLPALTQPRFLGDTYIYVNEIRAYDTGESHALANMWDFGHVAWRWIGYGLFAAGRPVWMGLGDGYPPFAIAWALIALTWSLSCWSVYLLFRLVSRFTTNRWIVLGACVAFTTDHAMLNYFRAGCSYLAALTFCLAALLYMLEAADEDGSSRRAIYAGLAMGASVVCWFPFILMIPGLLLAPMLLEGNSRRDKYLPAILAASILGAVWYGAALVSMHFYTIRDILDWVGKSSHGFTQNRRLQRWVFGFPRSFLFAANDGIQIKRYLFHDPYAGVTLASLLKGPVLKVILFFTYLASLLFALSRLDRLRPLWWCLLGLLPVTLFAILLFESGATERYLALLPFLIVPGAIAAARLPWFRWVSGGMIAFMAVNNINAMWAPSVQATLNKTAGRIEGSAQHYNPASIEIVANMQDDLPLLGSAMVYYPLNRATPPACRVALQSSSIFAPMWKELGATYALHAWKAGGDVWVATRILAERPQPEWLWTEADDPYARWQDLHGFYQQFEYTNERLGGEDGFVKLRDSPANHAIIFPLGDRYQQWLIQEKISSPDADQSR